MVRNELHIHLKTLQRLVLEITDIIPQLQVIGTDNQLGVIKTFNDSSKAPVLGVTAPRYLVYSLHGLMCQRHHPHLSLCQKDGCNAGNGGDMKEVGIPRWSSVEQMVPLCDGFESSTALKCGRIEIYKCRGQTQDTC